MMGNLIPPTTGGMMGVVLYRPGDTHTRKGVKCEAKVFEGNSVKDALNTGWCYCPVECYGEKAPPPDGGEDFAVLRQTARELGIKNWYNKGIQKLILEIDEWQTAKQTE